MALVSSMTSSPLYHEAKKPSSSVVQKVLYNLVHAWCSARHNVCSAKPGDSALVFISPHIVGRFMEDSLSLLGAGNGREPRFVMLYSVI